VVSARDVLVGAKGQEADHPGRGKLPQRLGPGLDWNVG